jgi:hypothetical protein
LLVQVREGFRIGIARGGGLGRVRVRRPLRVVDARFLPKQRSDPREGSMA